MFLTHFYFIFYSCYNRIHRVYDEQKSNGNSHDKKATKKQMTIESPFKLKII